MVVFAQAGEVVVAGGAVRVGGLVVEVAAAGAGAAAGEAAASVAEGDEAVQRVGGPVGIGARWGAQAGAGGGGGAEFGAVGECEQGARQLVDQGDAGSFGQGGVDQPADAQQPGQRGPGGGGAGGVGRAVRAGGGVGVAELPRRGQFLGPQRGDPGIAESRRGAVGLVGGVAVDIRTVVGVGIIDLGTVA